MKEIISLDSEIHWGIGREESLALFRASLPLESSLR